MVPEALTDLEKARSLIQQVQPQLEELAAVVARAQKVVASAERTGPTERTGTRGKSAAEFVKTRRAASDSERELVGLLRRAGFKAHREFASAPVRAARPDVWAYRPPRQSYAFEVKNTTRKDHSGVYTVVVPCWQMVKVHDFLTTWPDHEHFPIVAAHLGQRRWKKWVLRLLTQQEVERARKALTVYQAQETQWRQTGRKGEGMFQDAVQRVRLLLRRKRYDELRILGYDPERPNDFLFWLKVTSTDRSTWDLNGHPDTGQPSGKDPAETASATPSVPAANPL